MRRKHKRNMVEAPGGVELNIMPFIDIFSLLCTFLLFSAVFISIGIHVVQVPFLTSAPPDNDNEKARTLSVKVDVSKNQIAVDSSWSEPPINRKVEKFNHNPEGLNNLHNYLVKLRQSDNSLDKADFFTDDDINYEQIVLLLDAIKIRRPNDPIFETQKGAPESVFLIPKVVMSSVIL